MLVTVESGIDLLVDKSNTSILIQASTLLSRFRPKHSTASRTSTTGDEFVIIHYEGSGTGSSVSA